MAGPTSAVARIEALRRYRTRPAPDLGIGGAIDALVRDARRVNAATRAVDDAWRRVLPASLSEFVRAERLSRGTLTLLAGDAATKYKMEQWLREGGLQAVQATASAVKRVVVRL